MNIEKKNNKIIIISSPSGAGKTTICKYLLKKMDNLDLSISYTTRPIRINEIEGKDYFFVNKKKFQELKYKNYFIETAKNFNYFYASPITNINNSFKKNRNILFDIDWKGAKKLRKKFKKDQIIDVFILPPNKKELKRRLEKRGRDNQQEIKTRLSYALSEMNHHVDYKYVLVNDKINETVNHLLQIINFHILETSLKLNLSKRSKVFK
jgi:guanylate kinase